MHWRGCWYEYVDGTYYRRSAGWMVAKVRERVRPGLRASTCTALLCLSIQPDMQTFPPLPPGPGGRVQRKESN
ncbi:hypothetical protein ABTX80_13725 [Streptomyces erythrochromogenes]|uniref:hypothetical protein n=1 Tax=Streptomyces erythrochromogenes TaxID=285574 RepID=UPI0033302318